MPTEITQILDQIAAGDRQAIEDLVPLVYDQMRQIAASAVRNELNQAIDPTELVHDAYIRLVGNANLAWTSRSHFYGACAVVIRRLLVDQARSRNRQKRGGERERVQLELGNLASNRSTVDLPALDDALAALEKLAPRQAKLVELRFFGGLTEKAAAQVLQVSRRTVSTDWAMARAWLQTQLNDDCDKD